MRKIGVQTSDVLDRFGIDEGFRILREAGFDCVDFNIDHCMTCTEIRTGKFTGFFDQSIEQILEATRPYKEAAAKYGITFSQAHAPFPSHVRESEEINGKVMDALKKCIQMCEYVDCPHLIVHPAYNDYDHRMDADEEWDVNIRMYSELIPMLKKCHVTCCLENMFTGNRGKIYEAICSDFNEAAAYIDELNGIAGEKCFAFCLDTGHVLLLGRDIYGAIKTVGDRIEALHIHDNNGMQDQHVAPFTGILDWNRFIMGLKEINYQGNLSFETFGAVTRLDDAIVPQMLAFIAATGRMFDRKIDE